MFRPTPARSGSTSELPMMLQDLQREWEFLCVSVCERVNMITSVPECSKTSGDSNTYRSHIYPRVGHGLDINLPTDEVSHGYHLACS